MLKGFQEDKIQKAKSKEGMYWWAFVLVIFFGFAGSVFSAVTANNPIYPQMPDAGFYTFNNTVANYVYENVFTAGTNGSVVRSLIAYSYDNTATHSVDCQLARNGTLLGGTTVSIPPNSGYVAGTNPVNILNQWTGTFVDGDGNPSLFLPGTASPNNSGSYVYSVECAYTASANIVGSTNTVTVGCQGAHF